MKSLLFLPLVLAACVGAPLAHEGTDHIEIYSGGPPWGLSRTFIYANDTRYDFVTDYSEGGETERWSKLPEGTYARARAVAESMVPRIRDVPLERDSLSDCPQDAGSEIVLFEPPVAGQASVSQPCRRVPGAQVHELQAALLAVLSE